MMPEIVFFVVICAYSVFTKNAEAFLLLMCVLITITIIDELWHHHSAIYKANKNKNKEDHVITCTVDGVPHYVFYNENTCEDELVTDKSIAYRVPANYEVDENFCDFTYRIKELRIDMKPDANSVYLEKI